MTITETWGSLKKDCHNSTAHHVLDIGTAHLWVGGAADIRLAGTKFALTVNLTTGAARNTSTTVTANDKAKLLLPASVWKPEAPAVLAVDWPDYGKITLPREWWLDLIDAIGKIEGNVAMHCMGGHGRTGTALGIIAALTGVVPNDECPVGWVRSNYCQEAVESWGQIDYLEEITDRAVMARPNDHPMTGGWQKTTTTDGRTLWEKNDSKPAVNGADTPIMGVEWDDYGKSIQMDDTKPLGKQPVGKFENISDAPRWLRRKGKRKGKGRGAS